METPTLDSQHPPMHLDERTWIKMGRLYRRFPFLRNDKVLRMLITFFVVAFSILMAITKEPCTCADQIVDEQLKTRAAQGDSTVGAYMKSKDDAIICATKRRELLRALEKEKKLKAIPPKS